MEPVEINAGAWYLRALRSDERVDDRPALAELGETGADYIQRRTAQWHSDEAYSRAVCEPTTGQLVAEVVLDPPPRRWRVAPVRATGTPPRPPRSRCGASQQMRWQQTSFGLDQDVDHRVEKRLELA